MIYEKFAERAANKVAKKTRNALLGIPFYREKLKEYDIAFSEVKKIDSIEKLDAFLNKYHQIEWVQEKDLINDTFSLHLSKVPQSQRVWVQSSSGYEMVSKLQQCINKNNYDTVLPLLTRKNIAYSKNDLKEVIKNVYKRGLDELVKDIPSPVITIFARLSDLCGSGTYPLVGISGGYEDIKAKPLYFGSPANDTQILQWLIEAHKARTSGIISVPSVLERLIRVANSNNIKYDNLRFIAVGGDRLPKTLADASHSIGAEMVVIGYSAQEVMPLGAIARGILSSTNSRFSETPGLITLGNLCHVRVTDKNGFTVSPDEEGIIRVTTPFEGTTLIDYVPHDIGKIINLKAEVTYKGKNIFVPYPVLDFNIYRDKEHTFRVIERSIPVSLLQDLCYQVDGYNFLISTNSQKLYIFFRNGIPENKIQKLKSNLKTYLPQEVFDQTQISELSEEALNQNLYPLQHHKPHNVIKDGNILNNLLQILYTNSD